MSPAIPSTYYVMARYTPRQQRALRLLRDFLRYRKIRQRRQRARQAKHSTSFRQQVTENLRIPPLFSFLFKFRRVNRSDVSLMPSYLHNINQMNIRSTANRSNAFLTARR
ncbi:hypothetical protein BDR07DRAFT_583176 [Suillus spraguei]|nr:hypothetical protein BDR07DRAFT_583176 [Suillus spraguei]